MQDHALPLFPSPPSPAHQVILVFPSPFWDSALDAFNRIDPAGLGAFEEILSLAPTAIAGALRSRLPCAALRSAQCSAGTEGAWAALRLACRRHASCQPSSSVPLCLQASPCS